MQCQLHSVVKDTESHNLKFYLLSRSAVFSKHIYSKHLSKKDVSKNSFRLFDSPGICRPILEHLAANYFSKPMSKI